MNKVLKMNLTVYLRVNHSTSSRVGRLRPTPGRRKSTWFRPPTQKWGLGQSFRGRRDSGNGAPSGWETRGTFLPVGGRGGEGVDGRSGRGGGS